MSRLEFGRDRYQKRLVISLLLSVNLASLAVFVTLLTRVPQGLPVWLGVVAALAIAGWLFTFVLLIVNLASYFMLRE